MYGMILTISLWQKLDEFDKWLFIKLNSKLANPFFDAVLPFLRESFFWAPFYIFILAFILINYSKKGAWWGLAFILTVSVTDMLGTYVFKQNFQRLRPCQDPVFLDHVRLVIKQCAGGYSFLSNHAANHFGLATFMVLTFKSVLGQWIYLLYLWALLISFAQIYVGVHYPLDIAGGSILGILVGSLSAWMFHKYAGALRSNIK